MNAITPHPDDHDLVRYSCRLETAPPFRGWDCLPVPNAPLSATAHATHFAKGYHHLVPVISIVIPTWNRRHLLEETLATIRAQDEDSWECLVVDDESDDGTFQWLETVAAEDPRILPIAKPKGKPRGPAASRNVGFARTRGRFVLFFDSDDLLPPGFLREARTRLEASGDDLLAYRIKFFDGDAGDGRMSPPLQRDDFLGRAIACEQDLFTQTVFWRRDFIADLPGSREDITMVEDLEFMVRAIVRTERILLANDLHVLVRRHEASLTFDPSPKRFEQRNLHMYDAYSAIVATLRVRGMLSPRARDWASHRRYELLVKLLKAGFPSLGLARRYAHLVARFVAEGRVEFLLRLVFFAPILWPLGFYRIFRPAMRETPKPG